MPRTIAASLLSNMMSPAPTDGIRWLLWISWNDGPHFGDLRLALHDANVTSTIEGSAHVYTAGAFGIGLPDEDGADITMLRLTLQDPDLAIRTELRKLDPRYPATVTLYPVLLSNANTKALAPYSGLLRNVKIGRVVLSGSVETFKDMTKEPAVQYQMSPGHGFNAMRAR